MTVERKAATGQQFEHARNARPLGPEIAVRECLADELPVDRNVREQVADEFEVREAENSASAAAPV